VKVSVYKTDRVTSRSHDLFELLDAALPSLPEGCIVAVAAKIVSLCEGRVIPLEAAKKHDLIKQESQWYSPPSGKYDLSFAIARGLLVPMAGLDESNANGHYVLWPEDLQASANAIREHLVQKHGHQPIGVIITDSINRPLQWGTTGMAIAYSGFQPLKDYRGQRDIFGREMQFQTASVANGLAAAAVTMMGEGNEQTPIALLEDLPFVVFQGRNPTKQELADLYIKREDDMYWPFLKNTKWKKGNAP
jgi:dihydrofolate synthase / folylpolyglutamate synthase